MSKQIIQEKKEEYPQRRKRLPNFASKANRRRVAEQNDDIELRRRENKELLNRLYQEGESHDVNSYEQKIQKLSEIEIEIPYEFYKENQKLFDNNKGNGFSPQEYMEKEDVLCKKLHTFLLEEISSKTLTRIELKITLNNFKSNLEKQKIINPNFKLTQAEKDAINLKIREFNAKKSSVLLPRNDQKNQTNNNKIQASKQDNNAVNLLIQFMSKQKNNAGERIANIKSPKENIVFQKPTPLPQEKTYSQNQLPTTDSHKEQLRDDRVNGRPFFENGKFDEGQSFYIIPPENKTVNKTKENGNWQEKMKILTKDLINNINKQYR